MFYAVLDFDGKPRVYIACRKPTACTSYKQFGSLVEAQRFVQGVTRLKKQFHDIIRSYFP
jgi:hypothetical protein